MNILFLKDKKIGSTSALEGSLKDIYKRNTGLDLKFFTEERDYSFLPKEVYYGEYEGIKKDFLSVQCQGVYRRWREEIDLVIFLVHEDNWNLKGVWGWNISSSYSGYEVEQCRWDKDNPVNTLGTMYHEIMHSHDSFIFRYTGVNISKMLRFDWDNNVVHGEGDGYDYIRHDENQDMLHYIGPFLVEAVTERRKIFEKTTNLMRAIINNLKMVVELQRRLIAEKKHDVPIRRK